MRAQTVGLTGNHDSERRVVEHVERYSGGVVHGGSKSMAVRIEDLHIQGNGLRLLDGGVDRRVRKEHRRGILAGGDRNERTELRPVVGCIGGGYTQVILCVELQSGDRAFDLIAHSHAAYYHFHTGKCLRARAVSDIELRGRIIYLGCSRCHVVLVSGHAERKVNEIGS